MIWSRRPPPLHRGDVRWSDDPRGWSGGTDGRHPVVLLRDLGNGTWRCAVINTHLANPVFCLSPKMGESAGVHGRMIGLPIAIVPTERIDREKKGFVTGTNCAAIEQALAAAHEAATKTKVVEVVENKPSDEKT